MSSVCLSLVANLRCSGLRPAEAIGILIPPIIEAFAISFLIYTQRNKGRKHFLLVFDSYVYLALCVVDFVAKFDDTIATSLSIFSLVDRIVGGLSGIPIFFYILFLYLYSRRHLVPILPQRFKWGVKILLTILIPIILMLSELGSLLGISYTIFSPPSKELAIKFDSSLWKSIWTLLNSAGLALLILYQFVAFVLCSFRVYRHWHRTASIDGSTNRDESPPQVTLGGTAWLAAGIKLGAIEALIGFVATGFGIALPRRLLRLLARTMVAWAVYKGMDDSGAANGLFRVISLDSIEGLPPRRVPVNPTAVRRLIGAPMNDTFVKMSPTATAFHTRKNVPDAMKGVKAFDLSFVDEKAEGQSQPRPSVSRKQVTPVTIIPALMAQRVAAPAASSALAPLSPGLRRHEKRVTVAYDGQVAPVLDVRFSAQAFADAGALIKQIEKKSSLSSIDQSSGDDDASRQRRSPPSAYKARSRSTPPSSRRTARPGEPSDPRSASQDSLSAKEEKSALRQSLKTIQERTGGRSQESSSQSNIHNPFADSAEISSPPLPDSLESSNLGLLQREVSSGSTEESLAAIRRLSLKFPPLPVGVSGTMPEVLSNNKLSKRKPPPLTPSPKMRPRSTSQPQLPSEAFASPDLEVRPATNSPAGSLDQDVASRTRRRIRTHIEGVVVDAPKASMDEAQWVAGANPDGPLPPKRNSKGNRSIVSSLNIPTTAPSSATFGFSPRVNAVPVSSIDRRSYGFGRKAENVDDMGRSPTTVYTRESTLSMDEEFSSPTPSERPIGRIARRALGIEQFLEKEKSEASHDGHEALYPAEPVVDDSVFTEAGSSRRRPRSGVDNTYKRLPKQSTKRPTTPQGANNNVSTQQRQAPSQRENTGVVDPVAREAFAAAWRTVESTVTTPKFDSLKKLGSVKVQQTPTPTRHNKVFSGHSMKVDEGRMDSNDVPTTSQAGEERGRRLTGDREYLRKARHMKTASVDSEIY